MNPEKAAKDSLRKRFSGFVKRKIWDFKHHGPKFTFHLFFFQRILRINSHVPWPVHWSSVVLYPKNIKRSFPTANLGCSAGCYIQGRNGIVIGKNLWVGPGVRIISADHDIYNFEKHLPERPIKIGENCWLGANVIILPGVELGDHVIVAAGSVVTKNFPSNCVIGSVPARIIKEIGDYSGEYAPVTSSTFVVENELSKEGESVIEEESPPSV